MKSKKHILIVDDVTTNLKCLGEILRDDYAVSMAKSGEQALSMLEKAKPDLILMDVKMPGMDGYETYENIKKVKGFSELPAIFLTADTETDSELKSFRVGACDFIRKPYEPEVLKGRVERVLIQEERNKAIREAASKDPLTGLWNRNYLMSEFSKLSDDTVGTFMILDLDNFKGINDTYGHVAGDAALVAFAKTLSGFVHKDDIVARIGGDEFAVYLRDCYGKELLSDRIANLIEQVEKELSVIKKDDSESSVSVGISAYPFDGKTFVELYNNADKALYYVKNNGKSGFHFYDAKEKYSIGERENSEVIDLSELRPFIEEKKQAEGPFEVEYNSFKNIYRFLRRYALRAGIKIQLLLFTLKDLSITDESVPADTEALMKILDSCIKESLRKNDVSARYTRIQQLVILMDVDDVHRQNVVNRILSVWHEKNTNQSVLLKYDIEEISKESES